MQEGEKTYAFVAELLEQFFRNEIDNNQLVSSIKEQVNQQKMSTEEFSNVIARMNGEHSSMM